MIAADPSTPKIPLVILLAVSHTVILIFYLFSTKAVKKN